MISKILNSTLPACVSAVSESSNSQAMNSTVNSSERRKNRISLARVFTGVIAVMSATPFLTSPTTVAAQARPPRNFTCQEQVTYGLLQTYGLPTPAQAASGVFGPFVVGQTGTQSFGSAIVSNPGARATCDADTRAAYNADTDWSNPSAFCNRFYLANGVSPATDVVEAVDNFSPPVTPPYRRVNGYAVNCVNGTVQSIQHFGRMVVTNVPGV